MKMKKEQLIKLIEVIVKKEVKEQLTPILNEIKSSSLTKKNISASDNENIKSSLMNEIYDKKHNKIHFTDNEVLNDILNETAMFTREQVGNHEPNVTLSDEFSSMGISHNMIPNTDTSGNPIQVNEHEIPTFLKKALTKDYSQILKASKNKSGNFLGNCVEMVDPNSLLSNNPNL